VSLIEVRGDAPVGIWEPCLSAFCLLVGEIWGEEVFVRVIWEI